MAEYLRLVHHRRQQTSIHRYVHPGTGRRVTVVGVQHVGEPTYFATLRGIIDGLEAAGAVVHCEGSSLLPCDEANTTAEEQELLSDLRRGRESEKLRLAELGWVSQIDGLGYPPQWRIIDLTELQIARRLGVGEMRKLALRKLRAFDWPGGTRRRQLDRLRLSLALTMRVTCNDRYVSLLSRHPAMAVLIGQRNTVALDGVSSTDLDTVLVWGAGHMPGLSTGLRERGFVRDSEPEWHTVAEVPSIRGSLWRLVTRKSRPAQGAGSPAGEGTQH